MENFDSLTETDKLALVAIHTKEWLDPVVNTLAELGYKIHTVESHAHFHARFQQTNYPLIIIQETFDGGLPSENHSLITLQNIAMSFRRYSTIFLLGGSFETLNTLQAFAQSVHCVVNYSEIPLLGSFINKTITNNDSFLAPFREAEHRFQRRAIK